MRNYEQNLKHKASWEETHTWSCEDPADGSTKSYCRTCRCPITPSLSRLRAHAFTEKHRNSGGQPSIAAAISNQRQILSQPRAVLQAELSLGIQIACHSPFQTVDHLSEVIVKNSSSAGSFSKIKLHRNKCCALITNVISPSFRQELKDEVRGKYSLMFDDSTDISVHKHSVFAISYYSDVKGGIVDAFLGILREPNYATGQKLFDVLCECLTFYGLDIRDCVSVGCDGGSSMVGEYNSVWSRIKEANPKCVLNKCVCHSLALCSKHAFNTLPSNIGFMLSAIPGFFSKSDLRPCDYEKLFKEMVNCGQLTGSKKLPFKKIE